MQIRHGQSTWYSPTSISSARPAAGTSASAFKRHRPKVPVLYTSAQVIELERHVPDDVFIAKPYQHNDILNACQRLLSK